MLNAKDLGVNTSSQWGSIPSRASPGKLPSESSRHFKSALPSISRQLNQINSKQGLGHVRSRHQWSSVGTWNSAQFGLWFWIYSCIFHKLFKITKIFIYTPLMTKNISTILLWENILTEAHYVGTLFQSCQNLLLYPTLQIYLSSL